MIDGPLVKNMSEIKGGQPPLCKIQMSDDVWCSATLIGKKHIITAAHCITDVVVGKTKVFCNYNFNNKKFKEVFGLKNIHKSEKYKPEYVANTPIQFLGGRSGDENNSSAFDFAIAELDAESAMSPMKILDDLNYFKEVIKDEKKYIYVVKELGLRLLQDNIKCYIAGYASERLDVAEIQTWANMSVVVVSSDSPSYDKIIGKWYHRMKSHEYDTRNEPNSYSLVRIVNHKGVFFPVEKLTEQKEKEIDGLSFDQVTWVKGEDETREYSSVAPGDSGGALFCKKKRENQWVLIGVLSAAGFKIKGHPLINRWSVPGTSSFKKMLNDSGYKIDKSLKYYGEK
jgi:secreted trypsin-like serine protease